MERGYAKNVGIELSLGRSFRNARGRRKNNRGEKETGN